LPVWLKFFLIAEEYGVLLLARKCANGAETIYFGIGVHGVRVEFSDPAAGAEGPRSPMSADDWSPGAMRSLMTAPAVT